MRRPLVLTGGPAVGKSTSAEALAAARPPTARIEVDDLRQLVHGGAAPWSGVAGAEQQALGARNACALARNFLADGIDVVITDVLTPETSALYRSELPGAFVVRLVLDLPGARERAATRPVWLTDEEFLWVHRRDLDNPPPADVVLDVAGWDLGRQVTELERVWRDSTPGLP